MDSLPPPVFEDFPLEKYTLAGKPLCFLVTSRSCPHHCSFCSVHQTFGNRFRRRSIEIVVQEIRLRYSQGYRIIDFEDDNLTFYQDEMKDLCRALIREFPQRDLSLAAMNGISYLSLNVELLDLMRQAGFSKLNIALVTSDKSVLETTKRPHTVEKYLEVVGQAAQLGFEITSYQILGLPFETLDSMIQTLCFNARLPVLLGASPFYLTPNSPIARQMGHSANPRDTFLSRLTSMAIETEHFQREDLYTLFIATRILNFLKGLALDVNKIPLSALLAQQSDTFPTRQRVGLDLLQELLEEQVLHAWTPQGKRPLTKFKPELFSQIWASLGFVRTRNGARIVI